MPADQLAVARPVMQRMVTATLAEDGCFAYCYAEDVLISGLIHVKELWRDQAALDLHFASEHIAEWRATWPALNISDRNLWLYEVGEPGKT